MNKKLIYKNFHFIQIFFSILVITFLSILFIFFKNNNLINNNSFLYSKETYNIPPSSQYDGGINFSDLVNDRKSNIHNSKWDQKNETFGSYMERNFINDQCNNMTNVSKCNVQNIEKNALKINNYFFEAMYSLVHNGEEVLNIEDIVQTKGDLTFKKWKSYIAFLSKVKISVEMYDAKIIRIDFKLIKPINEIRVQSMKYRSKGSRGNIIMEHDSGFHPGTKDKEFELIVNDPIDISNDLKTFELIIEWGTDMNDGDISNGTWVFSTTKDKAYSNVASEDHEIKIESLEIDYDSIIYNDNSPDSKKNYMFDFDFTLEYKKKWLTNNKDHLNSSAIINPIYMFSSSHWNSPGEWKYNKTPMWIDFYFVNNDGSGGESLELFDTYIIENDIWEQDPEPNENLLHKHTFHVEDFVLKSNSFQGKKKDSIIMEMVSGPLGTQVSKLEANNKSYFMSRKISIFNMGHSKMPYYFNFGSNYSDLNVEYLGVQDGNRKFKFKFEAHIINPARVRSKRLVYKLNHDDNDSNFWEYTNFTFPKYSQNSKNPIIENIEATIDIPSSDNIQFAVDGLTDDDNPLYTWIIPEIPLNTNIIFKKTIIESHTSRGIITSIEFDASKELNGKKLWWNEKYITRHNFVEHLILSNDGTSDNGTHIIQPGINSIKIFIPIERFNIDKEEDNFELSFSLGYTEETSKTPPPLSNTTNSFYDKKVIGDNGKDNLPSSESPSESPLERIIKTLIIIVIILSSIFIILFSSSIGILARSNKKTRMVIASMDDDIFNTKNMEEDFELSL